MAALCLSECTLMSSSVTNSDVRLEGLNRCGESDQDLAQQKPKPADEAADLIAGEAAHRSVVLA
jgi:hypothetical protein